MTPADYAWPDDDLRARLEIAEATNHVLTELIYELVQQQPQRRLVSIAFDAGWDAKEAFDRFNPGREA